MITIIFTLSWFGQGCRQSSKLVAGIDDDGFEAVFVADNGTVAAQHAHGKNFMDHRDNGDTMTDTTSVAMTHYEQRGPDRSFKPGKDSGYW